MLWDFQVKYIVKIYATHLINFYLVIKLDFEVLNISFGVNINIKSFTCSDIIFIVKDFKIEFEFVILEFLTESLTFV